MFLPLVVLAVGAGLVTIFSVAMFCAVFAPRVPRWVRTVFAVALLPFALFCVLGFFAAMEPGPSHMAWRIGYVVALVACLLAISRLLLTASRSTTTRETPDDVDP